MEIADNQFKYELGTPLACYNDDDRNNPVFGSITKRIISGTHKLYMILWSDEQFEMEYGESQIKDYLGVLKLHMEENNASA